ncbi:UNVERIFIED_ORG: hypothetical protein J2W82_005308 [Pseudomonas mohnii]|jgi:hypothetical protein|nr:hypothetical protein [Pseudomonas mohnii]
MGRTKHPKKEIEEALKHAESTKSKPSKPQ